MGEVARFRSGKISEHDCDIDSDETVNDDCCNNLTTANDMRGRVVFTWHSHRMDLVKRQKYLHVHHYQKAAVVAAQRTKNVL